MTPTPHASRGSLGGSSGDAGVEYRRAVAAYAAVCGLAGVPLAGVEISDADAQVSSVALETDSPVDDISVHFSTGWTAFIQAKRTLKQGKTLDKALAQWVEAGRLGVDPTRQRLVIVAASLTRSMRALRDVLNRQRLTSPGAPTPDEDRVLSYVRDRLAGLDEAEQEQVLRAAVIWELPVEDPADSGAREALGYLRTIGVPIVAGDAGSAWNTLIGAAGKLARRRAGHDLVGWLNELRASGLTVGSRGDTPAGRIEEKQKVLNRYFERLAREGREIDLRGLGAELPPLAVAEADARVRVAIGDPDERRDAELFWAFLRRGRVVLTGLPGAGKSTAVRRTAGRLAELLAKRSISELEGEAGWPFPVVASLRDINGLQDGTSFRDRLVRVAVAEQPLGDRRMLREEIERRLGGGEQTALFLDALDETYDDRARVVGEIQRFLAGVPEDVSVLIATRDVAYGQAATLGWSDLRLKPPTETDAVVKATLAAAANQRAVEASEVATWISERKRWVDGVLARDAALVETPLLPVLLALLAIRRSPAQIPRKRAEVLQAVVADFVARHELRRQDGTSFVPLTGESVSTAAMQAFACEASVILDSTGVADVQDVQHAIATELAHGSHLPPGRAEVVARAAIRLFDETGVFVSSESTGTVSPRFSLFAEIGDVVNAMRRPDEIAGWVAKRLAGGQLEPVVLAATMHPDVGREIQQALSEDLDNLELARAALRACHEGAEIEPAALDRARRCLINSIARGSAEGWQDWSRLRDIGLTTGTEELARAAAAQHSDRHELLVRAEIALGNGDEATLVAQPGAVLEILRIRSLPASPVETPRPLQLKWLLTDRALRDVQLKAAEALLGRHPEALAAVRELTVNSPQHMQNSLLRLLDLRGQGEVAAGIRAEIDARSGAAMTNLFLPQSQDRDPEFLALVAKATPSELTPTQRTRLDELADFVETLGLNEPGAGSLFTRSDSFLLRLVDVLVELFGFNRSVLAAESRVVLGRMAAEGTNRPYYALFDAADSRESTAWHGVDDVSGAVDQLMELFALTVPLAELAMVCLWAAPAEVAAEAAPRLRDYLPRPDSSPEHQRLAAHTLASLSSERELSLWVRSPNPVLRTVAAERIDGMADGELAPDFELLLRDDDGHVREAALSKLPELPSAVLAPLLEELALDRVGWMCLGCRTVNRAGLSRCTQDGCFRASPAPEDVARRKLAEVNLNSDRRRG